MFCAVSTIFESSNCIMSSTCSSAMQGENQDYPTLKGGVNVGSKTDWIWGWGGSKKESIKAKIPITQTKLETWKAWESIRPVTIDFKQPSIYKKHFLLIMNGKLHPSLYLTSVWWKRYAYKDGDWQEIRYMIARSLLASRADSKIRKIVICLQENTKTVHRAKKESGKIRVPKTVQTSGNS